MIEEIILKHMKCFAQIWPFYTELSRHLCRYNYVNNTLSATSNDISNIVQGCKELFKILRAGEFHKPHDKGQQNPVL